MRTDQEHPVTIFDAVSEMEGDILDVTSWAMAFQSTANSVERIDPAVINVMADALFALGTRLKVQHGEAIRISLTLEYMQSEGPAS